MAYDINDDVRQLEKMLREYVKAAVRQYEEYEEKEASTAGQGLDGIGS